MNEQRNLYLAIGISIAIIIFFQILIPTQPISDQSMKNDELIEPEESPHEEEEEEEEEEEDNTNHEDGIR